MMSETIEQGRRHLRITEHHLMPWTLSGESLRSGWLIRIILFLATAYRSLIAGQGVVPA
jgi:hypothetical protein